jgi:nitronate monooxygenase
VKQTDAGRGEGETSVSWRTTRFTRATGARLPIVAAPMAGGPTTPALVVAVSEAGGLGVLAASYLAVDELRRQIREVRARTAAAFGVNVLLSAPVEADETEVRAARRALQPFADELGVSVGPPDPEPGGPDELRRQLDVVVEEGVQFLSFTFGCLGAGHLTRLREAGVTTCGTATSVAEARALAEAGVDIVCAQGAEAGGHRGGFLPGTPPEGIGTAALVPLVRDAVDLPVAAAGGLTDGRAVVAALALGAEAAQLGTAFLLCPRPARARPTARR